MLHAIGLAVILIGLVCFVYLERKKAREAKAEHNQYSKDLDGLLKERILAENRKKVIGMVHDFLKEAKFIKPIAVKNDEKIFQFVYLDGFLYEFYEILAENNKRIGRDSENLCFRDLSYMRVNNPQKFLEDFAQELETTPVGNPNVKDKGLGMTAEMEKEQSVADDEANNKALAANA